MARELSPEEKLLNLIKRKKKAKAFTEKENRETPVPPKEEPAGYKLEKDSILLPLLDFNKLIRLENIKIVNAALFVILIIMIFYFVIDIFLIPSKAPVFIEEEGIERLPKTEESEIQPYSYYSKDLKAKEIFRPIVREETKELVPEIPVEELIGNLALLGIVSGESPQAIIEDKTQKKTFFLREGQSAGGVLLKRIEDGTVTVIYKGEEFNLTM